MTLYTILEFPSNGLISAQIVKCGFCGWQGESPVKKILKLAGKDFPIECRQCGAIGLAPLDKLNHIPHNARMSPKIKPKAGKRKSVTRRPKLRGRGGPGRGQGAHPIIPGTRQLKRAVFLDDETFAFYVKAGGVYVEGKRAGQPSGKVSDEQAAWLNALNALGIKAVICWRFEEARDTLEWYLEGDTPPAGIVWPEWTFACSYDATRKDEIT